MPLWYYLDVVICVFILFFILFLWYFLWIMGSDSNKDNDGDDIVNF